MGRLLTGKHRGRSCDVLCCCLHCLCHQGSLMTRPAGGEVLLLKHLEGPCSNRCTGIQPLDEGASQAHLPSPSLQEPRPHALHPAVQHACSRSRWHTTKTTLPPIQTHLLPALCAARCCCLVEPTGVLISSRPPAMPQQSQSTNTAVTGTQHQMSRQDGSRTRGSQRRQATDI